MIGKLQITYNRTRQAVITTELIEIISGSVALESKDWFVLFLFVSRKIAVVIENMQMILKFIEKSVFRT